jgi:hypothetical protein
LSKLSLYLILDKYDEKPFSRLVGNIGVLDKLPHSKEVAAYTTRRSSIIQTYSYLYSAAGTYQL